MTVSSPARRLGTDAGGRDTPMPNAGEPGTGEKVLYRVPEVERLLSLSRSVIYHQIRTGRLRTVKEGRTRLIPADAIAEYVALLTAEAEASR
jgi:excisionase family DNA binding protein